MDEQIRDKFENWYSDDGTYPRAVERSATGDYVYMGASTAWMAWQACAAALSQPAEVVRPVLLDVEAERVRQDAKWGGPNHDDSHGVADFAQLIEDYAGWARTMAGMGSYDKARNRLIQVAALAVACCESIDRATPKEQ